MTAWVAGACDQARDTVIDQSSFCVCAWEGPTLCTHYDKQHVRGRQVSKECSLTLFLSKQTLHYCLVCSREEADCVHVTLFTSSLCHKPHCPRAHNRCLPHSHVHNDTRSLTVPLPVFNHHLEAYTHFLLLIQSSRQAFLCRTGENRISDLFSFQATPLLRLLPQPSQGGASGHAHTHVFSYAGPPSLNMAATSPPWSTLHKPHLLLHVRSTQVYPFRASVQTATCSNAIPQHLSFGRCIHRAACVTLQTTLSLWNQQAWMLASFTYSLPANQRYF